MIIMPNCQFVKQSFNDIFSSSHSSALLLSVKPQCRLSGQVAIITISRPICIPEYLYEKERVAFATIDTVDYSIIQIFTIFTNFQKYENSRIFTNFTMQTNEFTNYAIYNDHMYI